MDYGLSGMTQSIRPSVSRPQKTSSSDETARVLASIRWDKFFKLKGQKEHERRTTNAPMPTDHELMLELNEGLKKGHAYSFSATNTHSLVVMRSIWPPSVIKSLMG
ncbi:hypothetical protein M9H77_34867 [Catharanthus roseus]|uniref:Uncharacterized protein n=1 Tax=Catharanthus roseus TaxID=4058 RepID=A0ACB9ZME0_CATRO|nr:hypothetical protein M9H77_34867 [Catharanthus roseus]